MKFVDRFPADRDRLPTDFLPSTILFKERSFPMKKFVALLLAALLLCTSAAAVAEIKIGRK